MVRNSEKNCWTKWEKKRTSIDGWELWGPSPGPWCKSWTSIPKDRPAVFLIADFSDESFRCFFDGTPAQKWWVWVYVAGKNSWFLSAEIWNDFTGDFLIWSFQGWCEWSFQSFSENGLTWSSVIDDLPGLFAEIPIETGILVNSDFPTSWALWNCFNALVSYSTASVWVFKSLSLLWKAPKGWSDTQMF